MTQKIKLGEPLPVAAAAKPVVQSTLPLLPGEVRESRTDRASAMADPELGQAPSERGNLADLLRAQAQNAAQEAGVFVPPVPLDTPKVVLQTRAIESLPPEKQARVRDSLEWAKQFALGNVDEAASKVRLGEAPVKVAEPEPAPKAAPTSELDLQAKMLDDRFQERTKNLDPSVRAALAKAEVGGDDFADIEPEKPKESRTGAHPPLTECPSCSHPLNAPAPSEPDEDDKLAYRIAFEGPTPFKKSYLFLDGRGRVSFRALSYRELDVCHACTKQDVRDQPAFAYDAYSERLSLYRLVLSMVEFTVGELSIDLPAGLSQLTNPYAQTLWSNVQEFAGYSTDMELLRKTADFVTTKVLKSESQFRVAGRLSMRFHSMVGKLEAITDRPNFMKTTAS